MHLPNPSGITGVSLFMLVNGPQEYKYIKVMRITLGLMGAWPGRLLGERQTKFKSSIAYYLLFVKIVCMYLGFMYLKSHSASLPFLEIGHNYITVFMTCVTISRISSLALNKKYHKIMQKFLTEYHLFYHKEESDFALETHVKVHKISSFFCLYLNFLLVLGTVLFNLLPLHDNYKNGKFDRENPNNITYQLAIYYELPFDTAYSFKGHLVVAIFNWYSSYICSSCFCMFDLVIFVLVFHVRGHFRILINQLQKFPIPASYTDNKNRPTEHAELYTDIEMIQIEKKLKGCIDYHRKLLGFTNEISSVFGPMLFVYYTFHQISDCLLLLEISQFNAIAFIRYGPLTLALFQQLIQLSFIIESIGTVTGQLKDAVYGVPWEYMDTKNRKYVLIFMCNVAEPVHVNALGLAKVGVTSMASILKTSFSYFAFLRSVSV